MSTSPALAADSSCALVSCALNWQMPAATDVTVNVMLGPLPDAGETVAMPLHVGDPLEAVSVLPC